METKTMEVRSGGQVVGTATYAECASVEEAIAHHGEAEVLSLLNGAAKTKAANDARRIATEGTKVSTKALKGLMSCVTDPQDLEQLADAITEGDMDMVAEIVNRAKDAAAVAASASASA